MRQGRHQAGSATAIRLAGTRREDVAAESGTDALTSEQPYAGSSGLPSDRTSFIGRERDVDRVRRLLADTRLLTLTGPGGVGKTRLAIEAARRSSTRFVGGIFVVELAGLRDPELLLPTIAAAIGLGDVGSTTTVDGLARRLDRSEALLV